MFPPGLRVAATVIVLAAISALYQYMLATPDKLFAENFKLFTVRETSGGSYNAMEDAYKKGNAEEVIQQFQALKTPAAEDCLLAGNAYLVSRNPEKAIESFSAIQQINKTSNTHAFEADAEFYLALSYLANQQPAMALPLFEKIHADGRHPFHSKASSWFITRLRHTIKN